MVSEPDRTDRTDRTDRPREAAPRSTGPGFLVAGCFLALAGWFFAMESDPADALPDLGGTPSFDRSDLSTASPRTPLAHPPKIHLNGFERTCEDCHAVLPHSERAHAARSTTDRVQHTDIVLAHGTNDRCLGCHHAEDRNHLSLLDGTEVPFDEVERVCRECHGLVGRDWEAGTHGRTHGSWVTGSPEQHRLTCTECHDPHSPAFPALTPLPSPHTLRLPPASERPHHESAPLWPRSAIDAAHSTHGGDGAAETHSEDPDSGDTHSDETGHGASGGHR